MTATIRPASPADAPALARLRYAFRASVGAPEEAEESFVARCAAWMAARLTEGGWWHAWLAEDGDAPVGAVWLQLIEKIPNPVDEPEVHGYVTNLYVRDAARGAGLGGALLEAALAHCESVGVDAVILWPTPRSRGLYERHGFRPADDILSRRRRGDSPDGEGVG